MNKMFTPAIWLLLASVSSGCRPWTVPRVSLNDPPPVAGANQSSAEIDEPSGKGTEESTELPRPRQEQRSAPETLPVADPTQQLRQLVKDLDPSHANAELQPLQLQEVIDSTLNHYPLVQSAMSEAQIAAGRQLAARGAFDLKLQAETMNMPEGFYENYRQLAKLEQPTWGGGALYGQYRIGDGDFPPWYGERETNEGGEFKIGSSAPLLQNRAIDARRAEVSKADLQRAAVVPVVQREIIESVQAASNVYWSWVAAGQAYMITRELLEVAQQRNKTIARQVELGNLAATELQQNERLVASRRAKRVEAERKLQSSAIKLSLFWRDAEGLPVIPTPALLPVRFPEPALPELENVAADIDRALQERPELRELALQRQAAGIDLTQGRNETLPRLDAVIEASKDVGAPASSKGDKTPFELEAGLIFDVPLQRRKALGKVQSAQGKITQIAIKQRYTEDKITTEVQDSLSALRAAHERVKQTRRSVELARQLVATEYRSFELGNSDVLRIALQEGAELDAQLLEIEALYDYFQATAAYQAALGAY